MKDSKVKRIPIRKSYIEDNFKIYPNPAGNYIIVEYTLKGEVPQGIVNIIDNRGIIVKTISLVKSHDYMVIQITDLPGGIYYCNFVVKTSSVQTEKFIISR